MSRIRELDDTCHGRDEQQPRDTRLVVAAAVAFIDFVFETFGHQYWCSPFMGSEWEFV